MIFRAYFLRKSLSRARRLLTQTAFHTSRAKLFFLLKVEFKDITSTSMCTQGYRYSRNEAKQEISLPN